MGICFFVLSCTTLWAQDIPKEDTPDYKVAFYESDCYHMQDSNGVKYGYGYEMMQDISKYLQCTFSYVGFEKSPKECEEMLRNGELDIYTAAKKTPEREKYFAFSSHPAITASTCMNIKRGNSKIVKGDYSTYEGIRIGLLERHTYNDAFIEFAKEKGFSYDVVYYSTSYELSNALIDCEVDAIVDSYIKIPDDEEIIENFGDTPYFFMVRKEDKVLVDRIDNAIDEMNINIPGWRTDLYNKYYSQQGDITNFTDKEQAFLKQLQADGAVVRAVMNPVNPPYSWYENENGYGIIADIFKEVVNKLGLSYEFVPVATKEEYEQVISSGSADIWLDVTGYHENSIDYKYKMTNEYFKTTMSILRNDYYGKIRKLGILEDNADVKENITFTWPDAQMILLDEDDNVINMLDKGELDGVLMLSYSAQKFANNNARNSFHVEVVPNSILGFKMGINSQINYLFFDIWQKALAEVSKNEGAEFVQKYLEHNKEMSLIAFLYDHPVYFVCGIVMIFITIFVVYLCIHTMRVKDKQLIISQQLSDALEEVKAANVQLEEQYRLVETISRDTEDVFMIDVRNMTSTAIKIGGMLLAEEKKISCPYRQTWEMYINKHVSLKDRERVLNEIQIENVLKELKRADEFACRYRLKEDEKIENCQVKFSYLGAKNSNNIVFGIRCIDDIIHAEMEQQLIVEEARDIAHARLKEIQVLNKKLEQALVQAEAANKAKSTFLFNMSHDIRTPLNAIVGYTELVIKHYDDMEKCMDYTRKIQSSSAFLLELINNVLEMARIESNKIVLDEVPINAEQLTNDMYAVYSELMKQKNIEFTINKDILTKYIFVDKVKTKEILLNLVSNAYKYTPEGGKVTVTQRELPCDRKGYIIMETTISDTGIGMSKEFVKNIFEEFTRENSAINSGIQGTGLGMAIVKRLVDFMGGTITVECEIGKGTTFVVMVPHRKAGIYDFTREAVATVDISVFKGKKILLVEDNDLNAEIATEILQDVGFYVERAEDGIICIDMLQKAEDDYYDLILMDVQMPNMDGYKATRMIRAMKNKKKNSIPFLALTANAFEEDKKDALEAGMDGHIAKPINVNKLMEVLASVLT